MPFHERHRTQKTKNIALALILLTTIVLFFAITVVRMGAGG